MSEPVPALHPSATEVWQYAQAINAVSALAARLRGRLAAARGQDARLAFADAEHAASVQASRVQVPLRVMTPEEQQAWVGRVPAALTAPSSDEPVTVCAARMVDAAGEPTGEWGLEALAWQDGAATAAVMVVCRDASDAVALTRSVREHGSAGYLEQLRGLATADHARRTWTNPATPGFSENEWVAVLRRELPPGLAERLIVTDPAHPHAVAWRELHRLVSEEVERVGADPVRLAELIGRVPRWHDGVRNPPALAHWALTQARASSGYLAAVAARPEQDEQNAAGVAPLHLAEVRSPEQALRWASSLVSTEPTQRIEAQQGFGRWGSAVDRVLVSRFPGLIDQVATVARRDDARRGTPDAAAVHSQQARSMTQAPDLVAVEELAAQVRGLDPAKPIDRRAAHIMLGRVPLEIDRLLAEKFANDPQVVEKLHTLYPDGLPEAEAATWRSRAQDHEAAASTVAALPDDPHTPSVEGAEGVALADAERAVAAKQRGVAQAVVAAAPTSRRI